MAIDKIGPVPPSVAAGAPSAEIPSILEWFTKVLARLQRDASTTERGSVLEAVAQSDSTAATVADLKADFNTLLAKMRTAGQLDI